MKESCRFFKGCFKFAGGKKLSDDQYLYLLLFWRLKRYKRDGRILRGCADPIRERVGLPVGPEGVFFVSSKEFLDLPIETQVSL